MKFGTSEPHNCFELKSQMKLQPLPQALLDFPYDVIVKNEKLLGTRLLKL